jgi:hypothetical protein
MLGLRLGLVLILGDSLGMLDSEGLSEGIVLGKVLGTSLGMKDSEGLEEGASVTCASN